MFGPYQAQGHSIECEPGLVEYVRRGGYSERFGARPMQNAAMRVLGSIGAAEMVKSGGHAVSGVVQYERRSNKCFLEY
jgi:hypothetical protein